MTFLTRFGASSGVALIVAALLLQYGRQGDGKATAFGFIAGGIFFVTCHVFRWLNVQQEEADSRALAKGAASLFFGLVGIWMLHLLVESSDSKFLREQALTIGGLLIFAFVVIWLVLWARRKEA